MRTCKDAPQDTYTTLDAYVAGFLAMRGHEPRLVDQNGKVAFVFERSDGLRRNLSEYTAGAVVRACDFVFEVKALKCRIHDLRREKGNGYGFSRSRA